MGNKTPAAGAAPKENKMGVLPVGRLLATMALPMMISMLVQALYNVVDSVFVSRLSENAFNAVGLAFPLQSLMIAVGAGTAVGINALLSRSLGEKRQDMADRAAGTGIFLSLCSALVFALIGIFLSRPFFLAQAKSVPEIVEMGTAYTRICLGLSVGIFSQFCFERLLQSTGRTTLAMFTQLIGAVINIVLDPILIFGLLGFPRLKVAGAALATVLGQIVAAVVAVVMNLKCNPDIDLRLKLIRWDKPVVQEIYRVGFPSIVMQSIGSVMTFGMNKILFTFTPTATAVFGAYFKIQSFIFMPIFGLNNGMVPIISYNYGAARPERVWKTVRLTIFTAVAIMVAGFALFQTGPAVLLALFEASEEMTAIGIPALRIISISFLLAGFCIIAGSVCQAIGNPFYSMIVSVCRQLVVLLPAAWLLAQTGRLELVWWAFPIAEIMSTTLSAIFLRRTVRSAGARMAQAAARQT
nr:MATE family efflux transporter [uncultured Dysosmobacter sp.]